MTERMTDKQMADMSGDCVKCRQYKERISELQLEVQHKMCSCAELQHRIDELEQSAAKKDNAIISHQKRISELEAKLERAKGFASRLWAEDPFALFNEFGSTWQAEVETDDE